MDFSTPFFIPAVQFGSPFRRDAQIKPGGRLRGCCERVALPLLRIPVMRQLLDVMNQAVKLPLRIDFLLPSECEAVELFVVPDVAEHRFHRGKASPVFRLAFRTIDAGFHFVGEGRFPIRLALEETHLPGLCPGGGA